MRLFRIARVFGVEVVGDASLLALGALLSWVIYLELRLPVYDATSTVALVGALLGGVVFLATVLAHEVSHTAVALRRGLTVKRIRLMIFGGASELGEESMTPQTEFAVAVVGPVTSALLGGAILALSSLFPGANAIGGALRFIGLANLALAVFNLLPGLPLDGGRILRSILWRRTGDQDRATRGALQSGRFAGLVLIGFGAYLLLRPGTGPIGIWVIVVGWFLTRMAASSARGYRLRVATRDRTVGDLMRPVHEAVPSATTVAVALDLYQVGPRLRTLVVESGGRIVGVLGQAEVDNVHPESRATTEVGSAMTRIGPADVVDVGTPLIDALQREAGATRHMVATKDGVVVGLIGHTEIAELLRPQTTAEDDNH